MKSFSEYNSITLNGTFFQGAEIENFCKKQDSDFFLQIASFINKWLNPDPFIKLKTSGSTGSPKTILVEKNKMLFSAARTASYFDFKEGERALLCLPVNYIAGKMMIVRALFSGLNLICINPSQNPVASLQSDIKIDFAAMIPLQLQQAIEMSSVSQIKRILLGGGPVSSELENEVQQISTQIFHGYGMTETLSHIALRRVNGKEASQSYKALNGIELGMDTRNCLTITAPDLSGETLITNDVVSFTGVNEFIWKCRYDNVIISGGIKLFPEEIESKLQSLFDSRFYLSGIKDVQFGEKLILIVEADPFDEIRITSLNCRMEELLGKYEVPKEIYFLENFLEASNGKIDRSQTTIKAVPGLS
ncbi:MAG: AMP-binding protein [Ginsengibacter sp.]